MARSTQQAGSRAARARRPCPALLLAATALLSARKPLPSRQPFSRPSARGLSGCPALQQGARLLHRSSAAPRPPGAPPPARCDGGGAQGPYSAAGGHQLQELPRPQCDRALQVRRGRLQPPPRPPPPVLPLALPSRPVPLFGPARTRPPASPPPQALHHHHRPQRLRQVQRHGCHLLCAGRAHRPAARLAQGAAVSQLGGADRQGQVGAAACQAAGCWAPSRLQQ